MGFFYLKSLPGTVWPAVPMPQVALVWAAYQQLDRTQWLSPAEIEQLQLAQFNALLAHSFANVPYYRRVLAECGIGAGPIQGIGELSKIPLLTRDLVQRNHADIEAKQLPNGILPFEKPSYTSGTNGVPIQVRKSNRDDLFWNALFLRDLEWAGIDPRGRLAAIRLIAIKPETLPAALAGGSRPNWSQMCALLMENGPSFGMDIRQDPRIQLEWLRKIQPDYLLSMPTNLEFLAGLVAESGQRIDSLKCIQAVGESLTDEQHSRIASGFGVAVKNLYSTTEGGYMASPCPQGHGLHAHSEGILAEVLDDENRPVAPGGSGRLVFTNLHNFRAPFIRYDIMDHVTLAPGKCPCGRGLPLWSRVEGRNYPPLVLPEGKRGASMGIVLGLRQTAGVHQFQMIQKRVDLAVVNVVPDRNWTAEHPQRIREVLHREFGWAIPVEVVEKPFIERPPGGKLRLIVVEATDRG